MSSSESRSDKLRRLLFERYSAHLAAFASDGMRVNEEKANGARSRVPQLNDFYICPLCFRPFHKSALCSLPGQIPLTIEDVPPKSVSKGLQRIKLLSCRDCNSAAGTRIESHLKESVSWQDFGADEGAGSRRCVLRSGDSELQAHFRISDRGAFHFNVVDKATDPAAKEDFFSRLHKESRDGFKFDLSFRFPIARKARLGILKAAYLLMFAAFGYSYLLYTPSLAMVRKQLAEPNKAIIPEKAVIPFQDLPRGVSAPSISVVRSPAWLQSFLVLIKLQSNKSPHIWGVFLPGTTDEMKNGLYANLRGSLSEKNPVIRGVELVAPPPGPQKPLLEPKSRHVVHYIWQSFTSQ